MATHTTRETLVLTDRYGHILTVGVHDSPLVAFWQDDGTEPPVPASFEDVAGVQWVPTHEAHDPKIDSHGSCARCIDGPDADDVIDQGIDQLSLAARLGRTLGQTLDGADDTDADTYPERVDIPTLARSLERAVNDGHGGRSLWRTDALEALANDRATIVRLALFIVSTLPSRTRDLPTYDAIHGLADHLERVGFGAEATQARYHAERVSS